MDGGTLGRAHSSLPQLLPHGPALRVPRAVGALEQPNELPFLLTESCAASGVPELAALNLVDMFLDKRAVIEDTLHGSVHEVGPQTTAIALRSATRFKVRILPPRVR